MRGRWWVSTGTLLSISLLYAVVTIASPTWIMATSGEVAREISHPLSPGLDAIGLSSIASSIDSSSSLLKPVDRQLMNPDVPTKEVDNLCNLNNYATAALELEEQISAPYLIQCAQDYYGGDLYHKQVYDGLVGCIDLCDQVESCHLVSFSKGFDGTGLGDCYLKSAQGVQVRNTTLDSARKMDPESTSPAVVVKIEGTRTAMMRKKRPHDENHGAVSTATQSA